MKSLGSPRPWLVAAVATGALVLVLLGLVAFGATDLAWPGLVVAILLVWVSQGQFVETYQHHYYRRRGSLGLWGWPSRREQAAMWSQRNPVRSVELSRALGVCLLLLALVAALVFLAATAGNR